jgi:TolA-binding protein
MRFRQFSLGVALLCSLATPAWAQSRMETQITLDMRVLQAQVQQLTLAVNTLAEKLKGTDTRLEEQANAMLRGFTEQKSQIESLAAQQRSLNNSENDTALRILQLSSEIQSIRTGLEKQQTALNEILNHLQATAGGVTPASGGDPASPPGTTGPARTPLPTSIPPSPSAVYANAKKYFYDTDYNTAIQLLADAIKRFPDSPEAPLAQLLIGESHDALGHSQDAQAAYALVIKNYNDPDRVSDAYYKQGQIYEKLNQKDNAVKSYQDCVRLFPNSSAAIFSGTALKRLGIK